MRSRLMVLPLAAAILACGGSSDSTGPGAGGGGGGGGGGGTAVATTAVDMKGSAFTPPAIKVAKSATVTWTNSDGFDHNVTFDGGAVPASGNFSSGNKALAMPATAGTYTYKCTLHAGMNGSVVVQ
jgi:plastocyanin